jgi:hypothetical protein
MLVRAACLALAVSSLALAGCGADEPAAEPGPMPAASPTPTPTPAPTATPTPTPPTAPEGLAGKAAQEAFATHVVETWAYSLASNDAGPLLDVSVGKKPCRGCQQQARTLAQREKEGWSVFPFDVGIDRIRLTPTSDGVRADVTIDIPETRSYFDDRSYRNTSPAHEDATFSVTMRKVNNDYRLVGFTIS